MGKHNFNWRAEYMDVDEISVLNPGEKRKKNNPDNLAFYFLILMLIMILTSWFFKKEILQLIF